MTVSALPTALRSAARRLAGTPRLSLAAVLCIALGTAAASAALTLVSSTLLRPLPFPAADRLVRVWLQAPDGEERIELSYPDVVDLAAQVGSFDAFEATGRARFILRSAHGTRRVEGEAVTAGYFELLGVQPVLGRLFSAEEYEAGGDRVVLLDHRTWGRLFGYDENVIGRTVSTGDGPYTVIGVLPESFTGTIEEDSGDVELWLPLADYFSAERRERRDPQAIWTLGRLAPGTTLAAAGDELDALSRRHAAEWPETHGGRHYRVEPLGESWRAGLRRGALLVLASSGLLLLVAAINVAGLLVARSRDERRELVIRAALGAERRRLLLQTCLETTLLVAAGSLLGLLAGPPLLRAVLGHPELVDVNTLGIPVFVHLSMDTLAGAAAGLLFLITALVAAVGPALLATRVDPAEALRGVSPRATGGRRARRGTRLLVFTEVAVTTVLVVAALLLLRSYEALLDEDLGFRTQGVGRVALFASEDDVPDSAGLPAFYQRLREDLADEPGVDEIAVVWPTVPIDWPILMPVTLPGRPQTGAEPDDGADEPLRSGVFVADAAFFRILDVPLLAGRGFLEGDGPDAPAVALVNRSLARRLTASDDPARVLGLEPRVYGEPVRVVGVVEDARFGGPRAAGGADPQLYLPFSQSPQRLMTLLFSTRPTAAGPADPQSVLAPLERRLVALAPASALDWSGPMNGWVRDLYLLDTRFVLALVGLFAASALVLSAIGLYALLAHSVATRRAEMGIRQALGATPWRIVTMVVGEGVSVVATGLAVGAGAGALVTDTLATFLFGVADTDPLSFAGTAVVLLAAAVVASLQPALRAAGTAPARVLRAE